MEAISKWFNSKIVAPLCRFEAVLVGVLPFPIPGVPALAPREWRDLADILQDKEVPEERRKILRAKLGTGERVVSPIEGGGQ
jgi:hypothetical protein